MKITTRHWLANLSLAVLILGLVGSCTYEAVIRQANSQPIPPPLNLTATSPIVVTPSGAGDRARVISCPTCGAGTGNVSGPGTSITAGSVVQWGADDTHLGADTAIAASDLAKLSGTQAFTGQKTFASVITTGNTQSGTTYTLDTTDCGKTIRFTSGSAITLTLSNSISPGCYTNVAQIGAGQVTVVVSGGGDTLHSRQSFTKTAGQYAIIGLFCETNVGNVAASFILFGDGA